MGWSSGSKIMTEIIETLMETIVDEDDRAETYSALIDIFEDHDCDTLDECLEIDDVFDGVYRDKHPEEDEILEDLRDWDDQTGGTF
jgi:hypothetical protein